MKKLIVAAATAIFVLAGCNVASAAPAASTGKSLPVINTFTADPANVNPGGATQISWRVSNATSVVIDNAIGTVAFSGATTVYPRGNISYRITATNAAGSNGAMVQITVNQGAPVVMPTGIGTAPPPAAPPGSSSFYKPMVLNFNAMPSTIQSGDRSTLSWTVQYADTVAINQGIGMVSVSGTRNVKPTETTIYTLTAYNRAGSATATAGVQVSGWLPAVPVIRWFTSNPGTIIQGRSSTLSWDVTNAEFVRISGIGNVEESGKMQVYPGFTGSTTTTSITIDYTLVATNAGGSSQATCQVTVQEAP
jgi:hypothetical protein